MHRQVPQIQCSCRTQCREKCGFPVLNAQLMRKKRALPQGTGSAVAVKMGQKAYQARSLENESGRSGSKSVGSDLRS